MAIKQSVNKSINQSIFETRVLTDEHVIAIDAFISIMQKKK